LDRRLADPTLADLREDVRRQRVTAARREVAEALGETEARIAAIGSILDRQAENFSPAGIRARVALEAVLKNPTEALAVGSLLDRADAVELAALARVASAPGTGRLDLALAVERAASRLSSEEAREIAATCRACPLPPAEEAAARLHAEVTGRAAHLRIAARELRTGQSNPEARLALGLANRIAA
ncbi:MAG: hypothetical protein K8I65_15075, partial [Thermoanaerobaculia bacterium]|nr:hypothetical protein [Thermoanaerobaculia bacterium]